VSLAAGCVREKAAQNARVAVDASVGDTGLANVAEGTSISRPAPTPAVTVKAARDDVLFHVQIARTAEERANGLIGRPTLATDAGVLFVFPTAAAQGLVTTNNLFPVDLVFIGPERRVVGIVENVKPRSSTPRGIRAPSQFVLETRAGAAAKFGIRPGQAVEFRAVE
jgi:uncharacterized membrane protein (UPF0127 family)